MTGDAVQFGTSPEPTGRKQLALVRRRKAVSIRWLFSALVLGGIAFLNTWDILVSMTLVSAAYVLSRVHFDGCGRLAGDRTVHAL